MHSSRLITLCFWKNVKTCQKAPAEAEKLAAALNAAGLVDGVISQDGDCICFGARRVYRSFSSENEAEIELLEMKKVESKFNRFDFIVCAILLGCDFFPGGVKGLGPVAVEKLLVEWVKGLSLYRFIIFLQSKDDKSETEVKTKKSYTPFIANKVRCTTSKTHENRGQTVQADNKVRRFGCGDPSQRVSGHF